MRANWILNFDALEGYVNSDVVAAILALDHFRHSGLSLWRDTRRSFQEATRSKSIRHPPGRERPEIKMARHGRTIGQGLDLPFAASGEGPYPAPVPWGAATRQQRLPFALDRISNDQNVNVVFAGGALK